MGAGRPWSGVGAPVTSSDVGVDGRASATTRRLAEFAAALRFEDLPPAVVAHAKECLLDTLGCGLFGSTLPWSRILANTLGKVEHDRTSAVWGTSDRLSSPAAALANGAAVHGFELDDLHKESILHPGSVVAPAALAAADLATVVGGRDLLTALVAGYEVGARVGMSLGTAHLLQGWHPTGTHGTVAAAAAAASVLRLTPEQTHQALGIAGSQAGGLMAAQFSSMVKRFHAGRAAERPLRRAPRAGGLHRDHKSSRERVRRVLQHLVADP